RHPIPAIFTGKGLRLPTYRIAADAFCSTARLDAAAPVRLSCGMHEAEPDGNPARIGRQLLRREERGSLATSMRGAPYASLVLIEADLGPAHVVGAAYLRFAGEARALGAAEPEMLSRMCEHDADQDADSARALRGREGAYWGMTGIFPEGSDLRRDAQTGRLDFPA